jgi:hypothetical protein
MEDKNRGYSGYSKSNRAVIAESEDRFPITECSKRTKLQPETIKEFFPSDEWHHVSKHAVAVDYYDTNEIMKGITPEVLAFDKEVKRKKREFQKEAPIIHKGCEIKFTEWVGTGRNKKPNKVHLKNATMMIKGTKARILYKDENGNKTEISKFINKGDFEFKTKEQLELQKQRQKERMTELRNLKSKIAETVKGKKLYISNYFDSFTKKDSKIIQTKSDAEFTNINCSEFKALLDKEFSKGSEQHFYLNRCFDQCNEIGYSRLGLHNVLIVTDNLEKSLKDLKATNPALEQVNKPKQNRSRRRP